MKRVICLLIFLSSLSFSVNSSELEVANEMKTIGTGMVWREADDSSPQAWKEATIENIFGFKASPSLNEMATVVPISNEVDKFELEIVKTKQEEGCTPTEDEWWSVELEPFELSMLSAVSVPASRNPEYPFDVVVIYPAQKIANLLDINKIPQENLPKGVFKNTVEAAIDLTGTGGPDAIISEFCCSDASKPKNMCDYVCGKTFEKTEDSWLLKDSSNPC